MFQKGVGGGRDDAHLLHERGEKGRKTPPFHIPEGGGRGEHERCH